MPLLSTLLTPTRYIPEYIVLPTIDMWERFDGELIWQRLDTRGIEFSKIATLINFDHFPPEK